MENRILEIVNKTKHKQMEVKKLMEKLKLNYFEADHVNKIKRALRILYFDNAISIIRSQVSKKNFLKWIIQIRGNKT